MGEGGGQVIFKPPARSRPVHLCHDSDAAPLRRQKEAFQFRQVRPHATPHQRGGRLGSRGTAAHGAGAKTSSLF